MDSRNRILNRIRRALQKPAPRPAVPTDVGPVFPPISEAELLPRFERELIALKADYHRAANWEEARAWVKSVADSRGFARVALSPDPSVREAAALLPHAMALNAEDCGAKLADTDLGITACDALVAMTGSVVLTAQSGFGRALSILPPAHMVVAHRSQLLPGLAEAIRLLRNRHGKMWPSMSTFITGPSRTADIEKILVLGAHGPKRLFILLLDF